MSTPPTIIIADPDPLVREVLRVSFSEADFAVLMAGDGPEAERFSARTEARLVVLDTALPGVTSYDACARIRRQTGYRNTPIVLTARDLRPRVAAAAAKAGATVVLGKPYAFNDLIAAVRPHVPAADSLMTQGLRQPGMAQRTGVSWGPLAPLKWQAGPDSGLSQNGRVLTIVRGVMVRIPLQRKP